MAKTKGGKVQGDYLDPSEVDWKALDRVNDRIGEEDDKGHGDLEERADLIADIIGGVAGDDAHKLLGGKKKG